MSEIEWIESDWASIPIGERVRVSDSRGSIEGRARHADAPGILPASVLIEFSTTASTRVYRNDEAKVFIERAKPALPTEPGAYESSLFPVALDNDPYLLTSAGWTIQGDDIDLDHMSRLTPLTRLEPVPVTAKKVLDALGEYLDGQLTGRTKNDIIGYLAAEFGVTGELGE